MIRREDIVEWLLEEANRLKKLDMADAPEALRTAAEVVRANWHEFKRGKRPLARTPLTTKGEV